MSLEWEKLCALAASEIETTLEKLPAPLREQTTKLPVIFEKVPNADLQAEGIEPDTLGLMTGAEFVEENDVPIPPQIILFLENIFKFTGNDEKSFCVEVQTTFLPELGHYLGLDESDLVKRGLE